VRISSSATNPLLPLGSGIAPKPQCLTMKRFSQTLEHTCTVCVFEAEDHNLDYIGSIVYSFNTFHSNTELAQ